MVEQPDHPLNQDERAHIVTARETISRALSGEIDADLGAAASLLELITTRTMVVLDAVKAEVLR
jgi:hypothetical protein